MAKGKKRMNNTPNIDALRLRVKNAINLGLVVQSTLINADGHVMYRGWTFHDKPYGVGVEYWQNGQKYREGLFGFRGLLQGIEYYPNGKIRFWGNFHAHRSYGPNPPVIGELYDETGKLLYSGEFTITTGGVGYPVVVDPKAYGPIIQRDAPKSDYYSFDEERKLKVLLQEASSLSMPVPVP